MKKLITLTVVLFFLCTTITLFAEENKKTTTTTTTEIKNTENKTSEEPFNTLFSASGKLKHGGYGAPVFRLGKFGSEYEPMAGARGGWIINHNLAVGLAGYGVAGSLNKKIYDDEEGRIVDKKVGLGYGGLMLEYFIAPKSLVNFSFGTIVGAGGIGYNMKKHRVNDCNCDDYDRDDDEYDGDGAAFFIVEPEINIFVNITKFFKVGVGASYRFVAGLRHKGITNKEIGGPAGQIMLSFGWF